MVSTFPQSWSWGFQLLRLLCADLQNLFVVRVLAGDEASMPVNGSNSPPAGSGGHRHGMPIASTARSPPTK